MVSTIAGKGTSGFADGKGANAQFNRPKGIAVDSSGNIFVADGSSNRIRKITSAGIVSTLAGNGIYGSADGQGANAEFYYPAGVAVDSSGNILVADYGNNRIRKITSAGIVSTFAGSTYGYADGTGTNAQFSFPRGVAVDSSGNIFVADGSSNRIRKITLK